MLLAQMLQYHGTSLSRIKAFVMCIMIHLDVSLVPRLFLVVERGNEPGDEPLSECQMNTWGRSITFSIINVQSALKASSWTPCRINLASCPGTEWVNSLAVDARLWVILTLPSTPEQEIQFGYLPCLRCVTACDKVTWLPSSIALQVKKKTLGWSGLSARLNIG